MSGPKCAHLRVEHRPCPIPGGLFRERWLCMDCKTEFMPAARAALDAEKRGAEKPVAWMRRAAHGPVFGPTAESVTTARDWEDFRKPTPLYLRPAPPATASKPLTKWLPGEEAGRCTNCGEAVYFGDEVGDYSHECAEGFRAAPPASAPEGEAAPADTVARELLFLAAIEGMSCLSRGGKGCVFRAVEAVRPDIAARWADGDEALDLLEEYFPDEDDAAPEGE